MSRPRSSRRPPWPRRATWAAAVLSVLAIAVAGCTSQSSAPPAGQASPDRTAGAAGRAAASQLSWHSCGQGVTLLCSTLQVPLDYAHPSGRKITLALSEVPATAPAAQRQGDLLVNPGGPGGSGLGLAADVAHGLDPSVAAQYNIIGFDPRGVGSSVPALHCDPTFFAGVRPDYIPASATAEQVLIGRARAYATDCERRYGWLLPYMTTVDAARDMDSIRAALGVPQISYFSYS